MQYLIVDGYPESARRELVDAGAQTGWQLFQRMLRQRAPEANITVVYPSDTQEILSETELKGYAGVLWTGCNLCLHSMGDERVDRQVELARRAFAAGTPQFGSCWAVQIAAVAAGGKVGANPKGREMGLARKIALTNEGREHPMYRDKPPVFDAFICHLDEVTEIPENAIWLAGNAFTRVQALEVRHLNGVFWGVQYHPEYTVFDLARLAGARRTALIKEGFFADEAAALDWVEKMELLHADHRRKDLGWSLAVDEDVLDDDIRQRELINWILYTRTLA